MYIIRALNFFLKSDVSFYLFSQLLRLLKNWPKANFLCESEQLRKLIETQPGFSCLDESLVAGQQSIFAL